MQQVKWGDFVIEKYFEKVKVQTLTYKAADLPSEPTGEYVLPALTAGIQNQGLNNYVPVENATVLQNVISISANGANTGATFFQSHKFTVLQDAYAIKWRGDDELNNHQYLFMSSAISKAIYGNYEWTNKAGWERIKTESIKLPITNDGEIDFGFIAEFVAELEAQRVAELETYLQATGLKDYTLTNIEQQLITRKDIVWKEFQIGKLFEKITTKKLPYKAKDLPKQQIGDYTLPCLTSSFMNQGLNYYVPKKGATILKNVISIPSNSDVYRAYYQSNEFTVLSDAYAIRWKDSTMHISDNQYLFMVMCINKVTNLPIYSYKNKLGGWNVVSKKNILLPTKDGKIDFEYMDTYITAIKKLAIKDVVLYADEKISATKEVIASNK